MGGEVFDFMARERFSEELARFYFREILNGLSYLHQNGVAHRDLKLENLLFSKDFTLKIADFGHSKSTKLIWGGKTFTRKGT
jgi:serine/threonine protein kinase